MTQQLVESPPMYRIAVLLTCFNRRQQTITSLGHLFIAQSEEQRKIDLTVYLTDDGCTDGTARAVSEKFPGVRILKGTGSLFWAGGMRNSWNEALKGNYDAYLLLNDDTNVHGALFTELLATHKFCKNTFGSAGVYVGSTLDHETREHTYGGWVFTSRFLASIRKVAPNGSHPQPCELGNANIMWVSANIVDKIGILDESFIHGVADYDYTLLARKNQLPVLITPNYLGTCTNDHARPYKSFPSLPLAERLNLLYSPVGLDFKSQLHFNRRNFPLRLPLVFLAGWFKVLLPSVYVKMRSDAR